MRPHGEYTITTNGQVIELAIGGMWNLEGMREFVEAFKKQATGIKNSPWAVLIDLRFWDLGTPETDAVMDDLQDWCLNNNQTHEAVILSEHAVAAAQMERYSEVIKGKLEQSYFSEPAEARNWLRELGFYT